MAKRIFFSKRRTRKVVYPRLTQPGYFVCGPLAPGEYTVVLPPQATGTLLYDVIRFYAA